MRLSLHNNKTSFRGLISLITLAGLVLVFNFFIRNERRGAEQSNDDIMGASVAWADVSESSEGGGGGECGCESAEGNGGGGGGGVGCESGSGGGGGSESGCAVTGYF